MRRSWTALKAILPGVNTIHLHTIAGTGRPTQRVHVVSPAQTEIQVNRKAIMIVVGVLGLSAALFACIGWWKFVDLRIRLALAEEQTLYFEEVLQQLPERQTIEEISAAIEALNNYYPSGTKQRTGSHLDAMVERARKIAIERFEKERLRLTQTHERN
jgi:uncharacterized protein (DUF849 family)